MEHFRERAGNGMPSLGQIFPYVLLFRERQTVVLERHPDHIGGPVRNASIKPIFDVALPADILPFFMRGGAPPAHDTLVANSKIKLVLNENSQYYERENRIRHQPTGCATSFPSSFICLGS